MNRASTTFGKTVGVIGLVLITSFISSQITSQRLQSSSGWQQQQESVKDRVLKSGKLRVGYVLFTPAVMKDPNTGKLTGAYVDLLTEMAKNLGVQIEWTEEVGYATMIDGLKSDRYDIIPGIWANSARSKAVDFSNPLFYTAVGAYVRSDDTRFDKGLDPINASAVKIASIDGQVSDSIAKSQFPQAQVVSHPTLSDALQPFQDVASGKADVVFNAPTEAEPFLKANPGKLKNVAVEHPVRAFGYTLAFKQGEEGFKTMLDTAQDELVNSGEVDRVLAKYDPTLYRVAYPYRLP